MGGADSTGSGVCGARGLCADSFLRVVLGMTGGGHVAEPPIGRSVWFLASQGTFTFTLGLVASPPHIFFRMGGGKGRTSRHKHGTQHKTSTLGRHKKKALSPLGASSLELAPAQARGRYAGRAARHDLPTDLLHFHKLTRLARHQPRKEGRGRVRESLPSCQLPRMDGGGCTTH